MGHFVTTQIHASDTETQEQYMQRVVDTICGIDSRITCNTTASAQYADSTAHASFDFNINNKYVLRLYRRNVNSSNDSSFFISVIINGIEYERSSNIRMFYTAGTATTLVLNGYLKVSAFLTDEDVFLWIGAHHDQPIQDLLPSSYSTCLVCDKNNNFYAKGLPANINPLSYALYKCDDGTANYSVVKCLTYSEAPGLISYIREAPISGNGQLFANAKNLITCTTVPIGSTLAFPTGVNYFAVDPNVIIDI